MPHRNRARKNRQGRGSDPALTIVTAPDVATYRGDRVDRPEEITVERLRVPRNISAQIYWVRQTVLKSQITSTATVSVESDMNFVLNDLDAVSSYTGLFDQYCIHTVVVRLIPGANVSTAGSVNVSRLYSVIDYDDSSAIGLAGFRQYDNLLVTTSTVEQMRVLHPRIAISAYTAGFGGFANQRSWIDCSSPGVNHFGLKILLDVASSTTSTTSVVPECEYLVAFRGVR